MEFAVATTYMYNETDNTATSELTPTDSAIAFSAGAMILEPKLAASASIPNWKVIQLLYGVDQFLGFSLSFTSHPTMFGSLPSFLGSSFRGRIFSSSLGSVGVDHGNSYFSDRKSVV